MAIRLIELNNSSILLDEDYTVNERDDVFSALDSSNESMVRVKQAEEGVSLILLTLRSLWSISIICEVG